MNYLEILGWDYIEVHKNSFSCNNCILYIWGFGAFHFHYFSNLESLLIGWTKQNCRIFGFTDQTWYIVGMLYFHQLQKLNAAFILTLIYHNPHIFLWVLLLKTFITRVDSTHQLFYSCTFSNDLLRHALRESSTQSVMIAELCPLSYLYPKQYIATCSATEYQWISLNLTL